MERGFDGWVRSRFHVESSDIPDIASYLDRHLFEPDWTTPSGVDDLFSWLTSNEDLRVDLTARHGSQQPYVPSIAAAGATEAYRQHNELPAQQMHHLLQDTGQQQPLAMPLATPAPEQQQQYPGMFPAGAGHQTSAHLAAAGAAFPASQHTFLQHSQHAAVQQQHKNMDAFLTAGSNKEAAAAAGHASTSPLQDAGDGTVQHKSSASSLQHNDSSLQQGVAGSSQQQKGSKGAGLKMPRRVTDAQRAAHKRFRVRRKEQVSSLVAEVAAKQAQLRALEAEHESLVVKARALDQLVASADDSMLLMQRAEYLTAQQQQQGELLRGVSSSSSGNGAHCFSTAVLLSDSSSSSDNDSMPRSPAATPSPAAAAASLERLEAAVRAALGRPQQQQQQQQQQQELNLGGFDSAAATKLQGNLPALQQLVKSLANDITQLVLQVNREQAGAGGASGCIAADGSQMSAAALRLQQIKQQVYSEFMAFACANRIDTCQLYSLNLETGVLVRPPPGHFVTGAQLLMQRLDTQTLRDIVMAHKLCTHAMHQVQLQRRGLLLQLGASLRDSISNDQRRTCTGWLGPGGHVEALLNAVDSNLRKEYVMESVFQWSLSKLMPPLLAAEIVVTSYPFLDDLHHIAEELRHLIPTGMDPTVTGPAA